MSCGEEYPSCWGIDKLRRVAVPRGSKNISRPIIDQARSHGLSSLCWELPQTLDAGHDRSAMSRSPDCSRSEPIGPTCNDVPHNKVLLDLEPTAYCELCAGRSVQMISRLPTLKSMLGHGPTAYVQSLSWQRASDLCCSSSPAKGTLDQGTWMKNLFPHGDASPGMVLYSLQKGSRKSRSILRKLTNYPCASECPPESAYRAASSI